MRETARRLDLNFEAFADAPSDFSIIGQSEWSNGWQKSVISVARSLSDSVGDLIARSDELLEFCQF